MDSIRALLNRESIESRIAGVLLGSKLLDKLSEETLDGRTEEDVVFGILSINGGVDFIIKLLDCFSRKSINPQYHLIGKAALKILGNGCKYSRVGALFNTIQIETILSKYFHESVIIEEEVKSAIIYIVKFLLSGKEEAVIALTITFVCQRVNNTNIRSASEVLRFLVDLIQLLSKPTFNHEYQRSVMVPLQSLFIQGNLFADKSY
jgi:hypothetical protein